MCCTWLVENTGCKKLPKICQLRTTAQLCQAISSQLRHVSAIGKKLVKQQYLPHMTSQYGELWPTSSWDRFVSLGHSSNFPRALHLGFVTAVTLFNASQPKFARRLAISWVYTLYIRLRGLLPRYGILLGAKITLHPRLALFYIGNVTAQHLSSGRQPNFAMWSRGRHLYSAGWPSRWALAHILVVNATEK